MHSSWSGPVKVFFAFTPLIAVPLIAIFGLPKLPLSASQSDDPQVGQLGDLEDDVGESFGFPVKKRVPTDLFAPPDERPKRKEERKWPLDREPGGSFLPNEKKEPGDPFNTGGPPAPAKIAGRLQPTPPTISTFGEAILRLRKLGIRRYQLQEGETPGNFHFSCLYTPEGNPRISTRFEEESTSEVDAARKVIEQIEAWRARGGERARKPW